MVFSREAGLIVFLSRGLIVTFSATDPGFGRSLFVGLITDYRGLGKVTNEQILMCWNR